MRVKQILNLLIEYVNYHSQLLTFKYPANIRTKILQSLHEVPQYLKLVARPRLFGLMKVMTLNSLTRRRPIIVFDDEEEDFWTLLVSGAKTNTNGLHCCFTFTRGCSSGTYLADKLE